MLCLVNLLCVTLRQQLVDTLAPYCVSKLTAAAAVATGAEHQHSVVAVPRSILLKGWRRLILRGKWAEHTINSTQLPLACGLSSLPHGGLYLFG